MPNYSLTSAKGDFALSGQVMVPKRAGLMWSDAGPFLLTGEDATLFRQPGEMTPGFSGASVQMSRQGSYVPVRITAALATTQVVDLRSVSSGHIYIPTGGPTTLVPYCSPDPTGLTLPFLPYVDVDNAAVTWILTAASCPQYPDNVFGMSYTKFVMTAGTAGLVYFFIKG